MGFGDSINLVAGSVYCKNKNKFKMPKQQAKGRREPNTYKPNNTPRFGMNTREWRRYAEQYRRHSRSAQGDVILVPFMYCKHRDVYMIKIAETPSDPQDTAHKAMWRHIDIVPWQAKHFGRPALRPKTDPAIREEELH